MLYGGSSTLKFRFERDEAYKIISNVPFYRYKNKRLVNSKESILHIVDNCLPTRWQRYHIDIDGNKIRAAYGQKQDRFWSIDFTGIENILVGRCLLCGGIVNRSSIYSDMVASFLFPDCCAPFVWSDAKPPQGAVCVVCDSLLKNAAEYEHPNFIKPEKREKIILTALVGILKAEAKKVKAQ